MIISRLKIPDCIILFLISCAYLFLAATSCVEKSATFDESIIIASGNHFLRTFDNSINSENPPFLKSLLALPTLFMDLKLPEENNNLRYAYNTIPSFEYGRSFLYDNKPEEILFLCRLVNMLVGLAGGFFVFLMITLFMKKKWGYLGFFLFLFCPNIMANSSIATVDIGVTVSMLATEYFLLLALKKGKMKFFVTAGFFAGLSMVSKYTGLLIMPIILAQLTVYLIFHWKHLWRLFAIYMMLSLICIIVINAVYGNFRLTDLSVADPGYSILCKVREIPLISRCIPLPYGYLKGFDIVSGLNKASNANIFMGKYYPDGGHWWDYYLLVSLLKIPLPLLILFITGFGYALYKYRTRWLFYYLFMPAFSIYFVFSFISYGQFGIRYVLPAFPYLVTAAVVGMRFIFSRMKLKVILYFAVAWFFFESCVIAYPDYLTYFNEIAGGPVGGKRYFADSNLDWGQDLPGLKKWWIANGKPKIFIMYLGQSSLEYYEFEQSMDPEYFAVGVTDLYKMGEKYYSKILPLHPVAIIGNSIYIYSEKSKNK